MVRAAWMSELHTLRQRRCLFLAGGGFKTLPYLSALHLIGWRQFSIIGGLSAGSIIALMLCLGFSQQEVYDVCAAQEDALRKGFSIGRMCAGGGCLGTEDLRCVLHGILRHKGCDGNLTFAELREVTSAELHVVCYCLSTCSLEVFSASRWPKVRVIDAVLASAALPLVCASVRLSEAGGLEYCDAGLLNCAPLGLFHPADTLALVVRHEQGEGIPLLPQIFKWRCQFTFRASLREARRRGMPVLQLPLAPGVTLLSRMNVPFSVFSGIGIMSMVLFILRNELAGLLALLLFYPCFCGASPARGLPRSSEPISPATTGIVATTRASVA